MPTNPLFLLQITSSVISKRIFTPSVLSTAARVRFATKLARMPSDGTTSVAPIAGEFDKIFIDNKWVSSSSNEKVRLIG
jgi:hypothetical protein